MPVNIKMSTKQQITAWAMIVLIAVVATRSFFMLPDNPDFAIRMFFYSYFFIFIFGIFVFCKFSQQELKEVKDDNQQTAE